MSKVVSILTAKSKLNKLRKAASPTDTSIAGYRMPTNDILSVKLGPDRGLGIDITSNTLRY